MTQVLIATVGMTVLTALLLFFVVGYRAGRLPRLSRVTSLLEIASGSSPRWVAIPTFLIIVFLVIALFGMLWDISLHIADGRDPGPLANPAHYYILIGLFGVFSAGVLAITLPRERPGPAAVRIAGDWYAPIGGVLIAACGAFSLLGFPLDDLWHRLFGQDVTLWGPTHLMLIGGAAMSLLGLAVLVVEGGEAKRGPEEQLWVTALRQAALPGAFLLGLSTFQAEFDFGVPQFRLVLQPMMIMFAAGGALTLARLWLGRGAALGAVLFFLGMRGAMALLIGVHLDEPTPHFPLYLAEALIVEAVAFRIPRRRPLAFGLWCGVLIGTVGLAAEWAWTGWFMPLAWPAALLPEAVLLGFPMAIAGAVIGAWVGSRLSAAEIPSGRPLTLAAAVSSALVFALVGYGLYKPADSGVSGRVVLDDAVTGSERTVDATVFLDPPSAADDSEWFTATAWQGGGFVTEPLEERRPGVYRTRSPLPVHGTWKAMLRLHKGRSLTALPIYFPADDAIPAAEIPAPRTFERPFVADHELLQREQKKGISPLVTIGGYGGVLAITLGLLALFAWALRRLGTAEEAAGDRAGGSTGGPGR